MPLTTDSLSFFAVLVAREVSLSHNQGRICGTFESGLRAEGPCDLDFQSPCSRHVGSDVGRGQEAVDNGQRCSGLLGN